MKELFVFRAFYIIIIESTRNINSYSITYMSIMSIFSGGLLSRTGCDFCSTDHITFGQCDLSCVCCSKHKKSKRFKQVIKNLKVVYPVINMITLLRPHACRKPAVGVYSKPGLHSKSVVSFTLAHNK